MDHPHEQKERLQNFLEMEYFTINFLFFKTKIPQKLFKIKSP
jgi:hypothetical protein